MKEKFRWCEELITFLISLYRRHKLLYNTSHPDYTNRIKRERAMTYILGEIQKVNPNVRMHFIKAKICNLRTQYMRERKKAMIAMKNEGSTDETKYEPTLWCYPQLTFLKKHCKNSQLIPNIDQDDAYCSPDEEDNEPPSSIPMPQVNAFATVYPDNLHSKVSGSSGRDKYATPNRTNPNVDNLELELKQQIDNIRSALANRVSNKNQSNEYDWLGKQVVFEISKIKNEVLQEETAWAIQNILRRNVCKDRTLQHQDMYRSLNQNQNQVSSTPKNTQTIKPLKMNPNIFHEKDPLAEAIHGLIDADCP